MKTRISAYADPKLFAFGFSVVFVCIILLDKIEIFLQYTEF